MLKIDTLQKIAAETQLPVTKRGNTGEAVRNRRPLLINKRDGKKRLPLKDAA